MNGRYIAYLLLYLVLHAFVTLHWSLWGQAFCFLYICAVLFLPIHFDRVLALLLAFFLGFSADLLYSTPGMHAAASVFVMFLRPRLIRALTPQGGYDTQVFPHFASLGWRWLSLFALPLLFVHHFLVLAIEFSSLVFLPLALYKALLSAAFTFVAALLVQSLIRGMFQER